MSNKKDNPKLAAALANAARGFKVFPIQENTKDKPLVKFTHMATDNPEQIRAWWKSWPNANHGILCDGWLVLDRDPGGESAWALLELLGMPDTLQSRTPRGGGHAFFRLPEGLPISGSTATADKVFGAGIDVRSFHNYVVGAGSTIDGKRYEWINDLPIADAPDDMTENCQRTRPKSEAAGKRIVEEDEWTLEQCELYVTNLAPEADEGQRDDTAVAVANMLFDFGATLETAREWLQAWNETKAHPPKPCEKIDAVAASAMTTRQNAIGCKHPTVHEFEPYSVWSGDPVKSSAEFVADFVPPDYLIDGLLQRGFFYTMTGNTGSGKTAVAMTVAAHVALGRALHERGVEPGRVLYFAGENDTDVRMRWIALAQHMKFSVQAINVYFVPGVFKIPNLKMRIAEAVEYLGGVALVIVDTSAAYFDGDDENDNTQMLAYAKVLRSLTQLPGQPTVLVLCHPAKHAGQDNLIPRGGGSFLAECDGNLTCRSAPPVSQVHWQGKFRGPDFEQMPFEIVTVHADGLMDSKQRAIPTVIARPLDDVALAATRASTRGDEDKVLAVVRDYPESSIATIATRLGWFYANKPAKSRVHRALERLRVAKLVTTRRDGYELSEIGKKEAKGLPPAAGTTETPEFEKPDGEPFPE